jgi:hypothetical protein
MHIHDTLQSEYFNEILAHRLRAQFFGTPMTALTVSLCYAKITPAALHCSDFGHRCREGSEDTG